MRFAPYLSEISFAFSKTPVPYTEMAFRWSNDGLETLASSHLEHTSPSTGATLPLFFQNKSTTIGLANLPEGKAHKGALKVAFTNGSFLDNIFVDYLFVAFLARFALKYIVHEVETSEKLHVAAKLDWQIDPLLMNRVDRYTIQSAKVIENQIHDIGAETAIVIHSLEPGDIIPITLAAIGFDGSVLGSLRLALYIPLLKIIPTNTRVDGVGYSKQIDPSGIQEAYQVNHHKTIAQMTMPTQQHTAETKSLGKPLSLLNPATVKSSDAKDYVNAFNPNEHNTPFDYSAAKAAGKNIAPQATASFNENHLGNYTLNHEGTLNKTTTVDTYTELVEAPQINNKIDTYQGNLSGDTFSKIVKNYHEQIENETLDINEHSLEAPTYNENIDQLDEEVNSYNVNSQTIFLQGDSFIHNGTMFLNGDFEFCPGAGASPQAFAPPKKVKVTDNSYAIILPASDDYYIFLSTVYGESASVPAAWEAVADSIVLRATQSNRRLTPGQVVALPWQYDAYINPLSLNFSNIDFSNPLMKNHIQFLKAYDYLAKKTLNMHLPLTAMESKTLALIDTEVRPIYSLYTNKNVLLKPIVLETCSDKSDTCAEKYKQNNPANPLKYYITNYYSPQGQGNATVSFLAGIPKNIDPDQYEVIVPNVTKRQFKFYNLPSAK